MIFLRAALIAAVFVLGGFTADTVEMTKIHFVIFVIMAIGSFELCSRTVQKVLKRCHTPSLFLPATSIFHPETFN